MRYFPDFVSPAQSDEIFAELFNEVPWIQRHDIHDGKKAIQPRLSVWYGDVAFRYGGVTVEPNDNVSFSNIQNESTRNRILFQP